VKDSRWDGEQAIGSRIRQSAEMARKYLDDLPGTEEEVSLVLTSDAEVKSYNQTYRGKNESTNVLSFPVGTFPIADHAGPRPKGDILLAFETVAREACELNITLENHAIHLVVHGMLHLFGYDHQSDDDAEQMEELEIRILDELGVASPYSTHHEINY